MLIWNGTEWRSFYNPPSTISPRLIQQMKEWVDARNAWVKDFNATMERARELKKVTAFYTFVAVADLELVALPKWCQ